MKILSNLLMAGAAMVLTISTLAATAASAAGTWKWTTPRRNGPPLEVTGKFEVKDGKLTGTVTTPGSDSPITGGTVNGNVIAFTMQFTFGDNNVVIRYVGEIEGDTIKGAIERPGREGGAPTKIDWIATRVK
jgi:hypothetical protein